MQEFAAEISEPGGMQAPLIGEVQAFADGQTLDVPGRPTVVHTPGHSHGHAALVFATHGVIIAGDGLHAQRSDRADRGADRSHRVQRLQRPSARVARSAGRDDGTVRVGHGDPWKNGINAAD